MGDNQLEKLYADTMRMIEEAKADIHKNAIDLAGMGASVEAYCNAVAILPKEEGKLHETNLHALMQAISTLGQELTVERDAVYDEIQSLEKVRRAHNAYHKTRAIKGEYTPSNED